MFLSIPLYIQMHYQIAIITESISYVCSVKMFVFILRTILIFRIRIIFENLKTIAFI